MLFSACPLREIGRIERSLFTPCWMRDPELRRRVTVGLNKGEAVRALLGGLELLERVLPFVAEKGPLENRLPFLPP